MSAADTPEFVHRYEPVNGEKIKLMMAGSANAIAVTALYKPDPVSDELISTTLLKEGEVVRFQPIQGILGPLEKQNALRARMAEVCEEAFQGFKDRVARGEVQGTERYMPGFEIAINEIVEKLRVPIVEITPPGASATLGKNVGPISRARAAARAVIEKLAAR